MKERIRFPVDLSEVSAKIVSEVILMAEKFGAEIHLLLVSGGIGDIEGFHYHPSLKKLEDEISHIAEQRLGDFHERYLKGFPKVKKTVLRGDPAEEILFWTSE